LLFEVELVNFIDDAPAEALEALSLKEHDKASFSEIYKAAQAEHSVGNELFKKDQISWAICR
jgi:hypothetical protein